MAHRGTSDTGGRAPDNPPDARCSFCDRPRPVVGPMVEGPNDVYICVECVRLAHDIAEGNRMRPAVTDLNDPAVRRAGHMHVLCFFHLRRESDGNWVAVNEGRPAAIGRGPSARDAVRALQAKVLDSAAALFAARDEMDDYFTNHAEDRLR